MKIDTSDDKKMIQFIINGRLMQGYYHIQCNLSKDVGAACCCESIRQKQSVDNQAPSHQERNRNDDVF